MRSILTLSTIGVLALIGLRECNQQYHQQRLVQAEANECNELWLNGGVLALSAEGAILHELALFRDNNPNSQYIDTLYRHQEERVTNLQNLFDRCSPQN